MNDSLFKLSRDAEKALDVAKDILRPISRAAGISDHTDVQAFFYTHPNANQYETTLRKRYVDALHAVKIFAKAELLGGFELAMAEVFFRGAKFKAAAIENKARLAAKREAIALRAKQKAEIGVDLQKYPKATEATYKALRAAVEPIRVSVEAHLVEVLNDRGIFLAKKIDAAGGDHRAAFPKTDRGGRTYELPDDFHFFFRYAGDTWEHRVEMHGDIAARTLAHAKERSTEEVEAFAAKLTQKIDTEADGVLVERVFIRQATNRGLWETSMVDVFLVGGATQSWHTQIIWNHSCLGKSFNQWPTRRIDK